jgi:tetratricopeptide (TPR) repeat protein/transglutaminase-like putative cysteine protease
MRMFSYPALLLAGVSSAALAGETVEFGPAPGWVRPVALPATATVKDGPAILPLVFAQHVRVEPGKTSVHSQIAMKFLSPQGLAAGTISTQWRPDKDDIVVHRLAILREGKEIDLLKSGKKFEVLRREANLEHATLDGQLTAVMQPDDLRVGDTIVLSMTLISSDPVLSGHGEFVGSLANQASAKLVQLRVDWPTDMALRHRSFELPKPSISSEGGWQSVEWRLTDPPQYLPPKGGPNRYFVGRRAEFTDFSTWTELAELFRPLFLKASTVPATGPLREEVEKIRRSSADPKIQAANALAMVEDKIRYIAIVMGQGNYVPASAVDTWQRRYGDCKAKTALLTAILRELGISAEPVLVSSVLGDGLDQRLPTITQFDHVIVRATIGGRVYWLDATRSGDSNLDLLTTPSYGWGLPLVPNAELVRIQPPPLTVPSDDTTIAVDARGGASKPAPTRAEQIFRGDSAILFSALMAAVPANGRDKTLKDYWREKYSDFDVASATGTFDRDKAEYRLSAEGTMTLKLQQGRYDVDVPTPGYDPDFKREPGNYANAPFAVLHPSYKRTVQTIIVPDEVAQMGLSDAEPIDRTLAGQRFRRVISKTGNLFRIEVSSQSLVPEISHAEALAAEKELRALDDKTYWVAIARMTAEETQQLIDRKGTSLNDFLIRADALFSSGRLDEAIVAFDDAVKADPQSLEAHEGRGMAKLQKGDFAGARADFATASKLGSTMPLDDFVTAYEAAGKKDWPRAVASASVIIGHFPDQTQYRMMRAELYRRSGDVEKAIADTQEVTRQFPNDVAARFMRIQIYQRQGKEDVVIAEADGLMALELQDPYGYVAAAKAYAANRKTAQTEQAFAKALAVKEEGYIYLNRAATRAKSDQAGRKADIERALKLTPDDLAALGMMADLMIEQEDYAGALTQYETALKIDPNDLTTRTGRGIVNVRLGEPLRADADFAFVRAEAEQDAIALNSACWAKGTAGVALESALVDCDLALKLEPKSPAYLDSKALVLLRLGRLDEAVALYTEALTISEPSASSLFGRAVALERQGDAAGAARDARAAIKKSERIRETYKDMGLELKTRI